MEQNHNSEELPKQKKKKFKYLFLLLIIFPLILITAIYGYNYLKLQSPMNKVIEMDNRNSGIEVAVRYDLYVNIKVIKYDLVDFASKSPADLFRAFLQFAESMQKETFDYVILCSQGNSKFKINGSYFKQLGSEYSTQNPVYTMRTFPEKLMKLDGSRAYGQWEGGVLGVLTKQMEDFNDFVKEWTRSE